eukprot:270517-Rhodomonas_salina.2
MSAFHSPGPAFSSAALGLCSTRVSTVASDVVCASWIVCSSSCASPSARPPPCFPTASRHVVTAQVHRGTAVRHRQQRRLCVVRVQMPHGRCEPPVQRGLQPAPAGVLVVGFDLGLQFRGASLVVAEAVLAEQCA